MNYEKIYNDLINKRKITNQLSEDKYDDSYIYFEKHHIIPRSLNGSDQEFNLVKLTPREHYIAHLLLWQISKIKYSTNSHEYRCCLHAIKMMRLNTDFTRRYFHINSRLYEKMKIEVRLNGVSPETRLKLRQNMLGDKNPMFGKFGSNNPCYGSKRTEKQKQKMRIAQQKYFSSHKQKTGPDSPSYARIPFINIITKQIKRVTKQDSDYYDNNPEWIRYHQIHTIETKQKISQSRLGQKLSDEQKHSISVGLKKMWNSKEGDIVKQSVSNSMSKLVWIHNINNNKTIRVKNSDFNSKYLEIEGWRLGRGNIKWLHKPVFMVKDNIRTRVSQDQVQSKLAEGYQLASSSLKNKVSIYNLNLNVNKKVNSNEIDIYLSQGWLKGYDTYTYVVKDSKILKILTSNIQSYATEGYSNIDSCNSFIDKSILSYFHNDILHLNLKLNRDESTKYQQLGWLIGFKHYKNEDER